MTATEQLEQSFRRMGLSEAGAKVAARGRGLAVSSAAPALKASKGSGSQVIRLIETSGRVVSAAKHALRESRKTSTAAPAGNDGGPQLEAAFKRLGLSESSAQVAARGRHGRLRSGSLLEAGQRLGLLPAAARTFARGRGRLHEAITKTEPAAGSSFKGGDFEKGDYAYAPSDDPSTWALLLTVTPGGTPDPDFVKGAVAAITPEHPAPNPVPEEARGGVIKTLVKAWKQAGLPAEEMPEILTAEALSAAFRRLGVRNESGLRAALTGRGRRL